MKKKIIYIGNFLGRHAGFYGGPNRWISNVLLQHNFDVITSSDKINKIHRMKDIYKTIVNSRKNCICVMIDTYSTQAFYFTLIAAILCRIFNIKYLPILRGGGMPDRFKKSPLLCKIVFSKAYKIITPSDFLKEVSIKHGFQNAIEIPNPIDLNNYCFKLREKSSPKLLWVRSMQEIYNPIMALEVVALLKKEYEHIELCMIGPDKQNLQATLNQKCIELQIEKNVSFTGKLSTLEWTKKAVNYDIFINTTHIDNTPVSVLESMALGLPVVSTNVGGMPYIIAHGKNGLLIPDGDVVSMAAQIKQIVNDGNLSKQISINARKIIEEKFSSLLIEKQWLALINSIY